MSRKVVLLLVIIAMTTGAQTNSELRQYFNCHPCDVSKCPELPELCEPIKENGICGCCYTCARQVGEACGFSKGKCARGLSCVSLGSSSISSFEQLQRNRGVCTARKASKCNFRFLMFPLSCNIVIRQY